LEEHAMPSTITNKEPYQQAYYAPSPTAVTRYMRTSLIWQGIRFLVINFKILKLMGKSHH
jgi:hypothetical protein